MNGQMREIDVLIRARYSLIYVVSWEERRVLAALQEIVVGQDKQFYTWSETLGLRSGTKQITTGGADNRTRDPLMVLDVIRTSAEPAVYVLKDFHVFLSPQYPHASAIVRKLRDLAEALQTSYTTVILLSPVLQLPDELQKDIIGARLRAAGAARSRRAADAHRRLGAGPGGDRRGARPRSSGSVC